MSLRAWTRWGLLVTVFLALLVPANNAAAQSQSDENWPQENYDPDVARVNEGQLRFISPVNDRTVLHSDTRLWLTAASLQNGWVEMQQCYRNLDAVDRTEVVYAYREMQDLTVTQTQYVNQYRIKPHGASKSRLASANLARLGEQIAETDLRLRPFGVGVQ